MRTSKILWCSLLLAAVCLVLGDKPPAKACLNEYEKSPAAHESQSHSGPYDAAKLTAAQAYIAKLHHEHGEFSLAELDRRKGLADAGDFRARSDYAVAVIRRGGAPAGLTMLKALAAEHPEEYIIAANLGTAFELNGDNANALVWIRKGMELNPASHEGTEWLHARILEAKIQAETDAQWLNNHRVLEVAAETGASGPPNALPRDDRGAEIPLANVRHALEYQLHERLALVKAPDAICADLLMTLGDILAAAGEAENAAEVYNLVGVYDVAGRFGALERLAPSSRTASAASQSPLASAMPNPRHVFAGVLAAVLVILAAAYILRRNQMRKSALSAEPRP